MKQTYNTSLLHPHLKVVSKVSLGLGGLHLHVVGRLLQLKVPLSFGNLDVV